MPDHSPRHRSAPVQVPTFTSGIPIVEPSATDLSSIIRNPSHRHSAPTPSNMNRHATRSVKGGQLNPGLAYSPKNRGVNKRKRPSGGPDEDNRTHATADEGASGKLRQGTQNRLATTSLSTTLATRNLPDGTMAKESTRGRRSSGAPKKKLKTAPRKSTPNASESDDEEPRRSHPARKRGGRGNRINPGATTGETQDTIHVRQSPPASNRRHSDESEEGRDNIHNDDALLTQAITVDQTHAPGPDYERSRIPGDEDESAGSSTGGLQSQNVNFAQREKPEEEPSDEGSGSEDNNPGDRTFQEARDYAHQRETEGYYTELDEEEEEENLQTLPERYLKRVKHSCKIEREINESLGRFSDLQSAFHATQTRDGANTGWYRLLIEIAKSIKDLGQVDDHVMSLKALDGSLPDLYAMQDQWQKDTERMQKEMKRRLTVQANFRKAISAIAKVMEDNDFAPQNIRPEDDYQKNQRKRRETAQKKLSILKMMIDQKEQAIFEEDRAIRQSQSLVAGGSDIGEHAYHMKEHEQEAPLVIGDDGEVEVVKIEAFGQRGRKDGSGQADGSLLVHQDRPWSIEENTAIIKGLYSYRAPDRIRLIKSSNPVLSHRSTSDVLQRAKDIKREFLEQREFVDKQGYSMASWWDGIDV